MKLVTFLGWTVSCACRTNPFPPTLVYEQKTVPDQNNPNITNGVRPERERETGRRRRMITVFGGSELAVRAPSAHHGVFNSWGAREELTVECTFRNFCRHPPGRHACWSSPLPHDLHVADLRRRCRFEHRSLVQFSGYSGVSLASGDPSVLFG